MYEIEKFNKNFDFKSSDSFCQACLSSDRNLSSIGEYIDVFRSISNIILPQPLLLCWECMAVLKKIKLFKEMFGEAQRIQAFHYLNKQKLLQQTLSKLTKTYTDHAINVTHNDEDDDSKQKQEIKQENEDSNYSFNNFEENDICHQEIKKEDVIDTKVIKKNKLLQYRIVKEKNAKKVLRKQFAIQPGDLKIWLESERNSDFHKKLRYKCDMCVNGFENKELWKRHIIKYHDESSGSYICPTCSIRFTNESLLRAHTQTHEFAWECARCGFQCYSVKRLNAHIKTHIVVQCVNCDAKFQDKKKHQCPECNNSYSRRAYMMNHYKHVHMNQSKYYCSECDQHFLNRTKFVDHMKYKHEGVKREKNKLCNICGRGFATNRTLLNHMRTHSGERPYECKYCAAKFTQRTSMLSHVKYIHLKSKRRPQ